MKITGVDELTKQLKDAEKALNALEGELSFKFDPEDPASIEAAIADAEQTIDEKVSPWAGNPIVIGAANSFKEQARQAILDRATQARLEGRSGSDE